MGSIYSVVIIDDNKLIVDTLSASAIWAEHGCKVAALCYDSNTAKERIMELHPDIIITDIRMPGMSGFELIDLIREEVPHARVIFISAYDSFQYAQRALRMGAQDYLLKPFSQEALSQAVAGAVCYLDTTRTDAAKEKTEPADPIQPIIDYISERIDQRITAEEVAQTFYMSTSRLDKLIQRYTGMGFQKLHMHLRMKRAKELMMDVRNNIENIAEKIGYRNYTSFYRAFTREFGMSPTEWRDMKQKKDDESL